MQPDPLSPSVIRFGLFEADLSARELRKRRRKVRLQDQPFRVLSLLLRHPGELVTREEFQTDLWPAGTFVEFDEGLNKAIQKLREALGDSSDNPRFIETLPRKGYRFIAPVEGQLNALFPRTETPADPVESVEVVVPRPIAAADARAHGHAALQEREADFAIAGLAKQHRKGLIVGAALMFALAGLMWLALRRLPPARNAAPRAVPFTTYPGQQITPALSPDGKQVAFAWDGEKGENFDIYLKLVNAGAPLRLTSNLANEYSPAWSPDGRYIAFCRDSPAKPATDSSSLAQQIFGIFMNHVDIWTIPALGGVEQKLGEAAGCELLSWSPDGKYLALADKAASRDPYAIYLLSMETGKKWRVTQPPTGYFGDRTPHFSPDGKTIAFDRSSDLYVDDLYLLAISSDGRPLSEPRRLSMDERSIHGFDWTSDGRRIVFSADHLWVIPVSGGTPEPLAMTSDGAVLPTVARTASRLVYEQHRWGDLNIWRVPGPNASSKKGASTEFIASTRIDSEPQFSPDGMQIAFGSSRSGSYEIWKCDMEGRYPVQLTYLRGIAGSPRWSPDSHSIAFDAGQTDVIDIYIISADGGAPHRLTSGRWKNARPSWSRDGKWVYFGSNRSGDWQIWKQPTAGDAAVQVSKSGGEEAFESADGKFVYWAKRGVTGIWRISVEGGEESRALDASTEGLWALTSRGICFFELKTPADLSLLFYSFASGKTIPLRQFPRGTKIDTLSTALSVSPDGQWILYPQFDRAGTDLMLVDDFR